MSSEFYKIVVLGIGGVGKSAVTINFIHTSHFVEQYDPTIEDSYRQQVMIDSTVALLDILDTAGQEEYSVLRDGYMRVGEGFILVFDITSRKSFDEIPGFYSTIERVREGRSAPTVLVGNKVDLEDKRQISTFEGQELAKRFNCPFFEASAKTRQNIDNIFHQIVREVRKVRGKPEGETGSSTPGSKKKKLSVAGCDLF